jgi:HK97 family phage major capsid protein
MGASNFYYVGESLSDEATASPPTTPATGDQTLTAKKLKSRIYFSDELVEDSIVPVIETLRAELVTAGAEVIEDLILNGDTTAPHQDNDVVDTKDRRKAWSGIRKLCPAGTKGSLATFTAASHVAAFIVLMGKYGINPADLAFITGGVGYNKFRALTEVLTVDKYGPQAVVLSGELGKLFGSPIIVSEYIRENLNATGVYDGSTTNKTEVIVVNRRGFMLGTRGGVKLTFKAEAEVDQNQLIMSFRKAFQPRWTPSSTVTTIAVGYNI